jgi:hypothetical protein
MKNPPHPGKLSERPRFNLTGLMRHQRAHGMGPVSGEAVQQNVRPASRSTIFALRSRNLRELVGQGDQHADFAFAYGAPEGPRA